MAKKFENTKDIVDFFSGQDEVEITNENIVEIARRIGSNLDQVMEMKNLGFSYNMRRNSFVMDDKD